MSVLRMGVKRACRHHSLYNTFLFGFFFFVRVVKSNIENIEITLVVGGGKVDHFVISFRSYDVMGFYPFKMHDKNIAYSKYADVCVSFLKEFALWYNFPAMQQTWYISE